MPTTGAGLGRELKLILDLLLREREREGGEKRGSLPTGGGAAEKRLPLDHLFPGPLMPALMLKTMNRRQSERRQIREKMEREKSEIGRAHV